MVEQPIRFSEALRDQIPSLNSILEAQLVFVSDIANFIKERANLEREYARNLRALVRKSLDKRATKVGSYVVGDNPNKAWKDGDEVGRDQ